VVHAAAEFASLDPPTLPVSPDWSPVANFGGYVKAEAQATARVAHEHFCVEHSFAKGLRKQARTWLDGRSGLWALGCDCFAV